MNPLTYGSLFTGAGGFDIGFDAAGFECAWQVEIDRHAQAVLKYRWPNTERHSDVCEVGAKNLKRVNVLVAGFPCQDLSVAGNREGLSGSRSGLFYEATRITRELQPDFLVWENVLGLLSSDGGRDFARVLRELADSGYHGCWRVLNARFFGVPQRRRRVFGCFARRHIGIGHVAKILAITRRVRRHPSTRQKTREDVAATLGCGTAGSGSPVDYERMTFVPTVSPAVTAKWLADGPRYRLCGNGVVGTVSEWIARLIIRGMS